MAKLSVDALGALLSKCSSNQQTDGLFAAIQPSLMEDPDTLSHIFKKALEQQPVVGQMIRFIEKVNSCGLSNYLMADDPYGLLNDIFKDVCIHDNPCCTDRVHVSLTTWKSSRTF